MANFAEGKILDKKYEILELIGSGGMAYVYKARDIVADRFVAIKVLKREYCESEAYIKKFNNEAKAVNNLIHPNIVQVYDIGNVGNVHYIAREYVEGITLKEYIEQRGSIPWDEALAITQQLLKAVEAAHAQHVIHRDIKPMNVLVTGDGTIKLSDFGIAKAVLGSTIQATKNSVGSVHYVSPEQARGGFVDERSDIYSIGVTLYEMIVGAVPFDGDSHVSIALKHLSGTYVQPHEADPDIPMGINDLVVMAMMKDPGARFQSATDMLRRLERVAENPDSGFLNGFIPDDSDMKVVGRNGKVSVSGYSGIQEAESTNLDDNIEISVATPAPKENQKDSGPRKDKILRIVSYIAGLAAAALLVWFVVSTVAYVVDKSYILSKATYTLGDYKGYEAVDVIQMLEEEKIFVEQELVVDENYLGAGYIISQEPEAGKIMRKGDVVTFRVSAEEGSFLVEDYSGYSKEEAIAQFNLLGMITEVVYVKNNDVSAGQVVKTIPAAGAVVTKDDVMTVYVSEGKLYDAITVPSLEGKTLSEAKAELAALGLKVGVVYPEPEQNLTFIISPTASPIPTAAPTETPDPTASPTPNPTENPDSSDYPWYAKPSATLPIFRATPTVEPTPEDTPKPTRKPTASPSPIPTISPSDYIYASDTVQYQYPAAGTVLYANETVDLYFYDISSFRLDTIRKYKTVIIPEPENLGNKSSITFAVYARPNDTGKRETVYNKTIYTSLFPLSVKIPVSYNGGTNVSIFINNKLYYEYLSQ